MSILSERSCILLNFRLLAAQMKYVGIFCLFLQIVMASVGVHDGHPDWTNPHTYVKVLTLKYTLL